MSELLVEGQSTVDPPRALLVDVVPNELPSTYEELVDISLGAAHILPPTHSKSREFAMARLMDRLNIYRGLEEDWDGYGGQAATFGSFMDSTEFVKKIPLYFDVPASMLAGDGEISLFWKKNGGYLEASFPGDNTYHFIYKGCDDVYASPDISLDGRQLDGRLLYYLLGFSLA